MTTPLAEAVWEGLGRQAPHRLGVAVSGGSDSLSLLHLMHQLALEHGFTIQAATVDHGLRSGSAEEAARVAALCAALGVPHQTLTWGAWDGSGNLQATARAARYALLSNWARAEGLEAVALGHTQDDQAETVLMRLSRRAGVDGLSAMAPRSRRDGMVWLRPMLGLPRAALRAYLSNRGISWSDDPGNEDSTFDRIRARRALAPLGEIGITAEGLAEVAHNMRSVREALEDAVTDLARRGVTVGAGWLEFDRATLADAPAEIQRRLWQRAVRWINGQSYPPRRAPLEELARVAREGAAMTLAGTALHCDAQKAWLFREHAAVAAQQSPAGAVWDGRWQLDTRAGSAAEQGRIAAVGANGLKQCDNWRDHGVPRAALLSLPGLWHDDTLLCAPCVKPDSTSVWRLLRGADAFFEPPL